MEFPGVIGNALRRHDLLDDVTGVRKEPIRIEIEPRPDDVLLPDEEEHLRRQLREYRHRAAQSRAAGKTVAQADPAVVAILANPECTRVMTALGFAPAIDADEDIDIDLDELEVGLVLDDEVDLDDPEVRAAIGEGLRAGIAESGRAVPHDDGDIDITREEVRAATREAVKAIVERAVTAHLNAHRGRLS